MAPLPFTALLLIAQLVALGVSIRQKTWRAVPFWIGYISIATAHLAIGIAAILAGADYPMALLYFEPAFILGQIAVTFESSIKVLGYRLGGGSPESKLLMYLIPLVPAAIILPIEMGFLQDALAAWTSQEAEALRLVFGVRLFLSITLFVILACVPAAARLAGKQRKAEVTFHHRIITGYLGSSMLGYVCKSYPSVRADFYLTILFFIVGPMVCFLWWSWGTRRSSPVDFEPVEQPRAEDGPMFERRGVLLNS